MLNAVASGLAAGLPLGLGMALATLPVLAMPLLLGSDGKRGPQATFLAGWFAGFFALGGAVIALADLTQPAASQPAAWVAWARIAAGLVLAGYGVRKWSGRAREPSGRGLLARVQGFGPRRAAVLGFLMLTINPKNAVMAAAGALSIAAATTYPPAQALALTGFALSASIALALPLALGLLLGQRARQPLARAGAFMARHEATILAATFLALGAALIRGGIAGL